MRGLTLDTDVVIAVLDRADAHHNRASQLVGSHLEASTPLALSTINYAEALVRPAADPDALEMAVDAISALGIDVAPPSASIAREAAKICGVGVSLADGFAIATARSLRHAFASFDKRALRAARESGVEIFSR